MFPGGRERSKTAIALPTLVDTNLPVLQGLLELTGGIGLGDAHLMLVMRTRSEQLLS